MCIRDSRPLDRRIAPRHGGLRQRVGTGQHLHRNLAEMMRWMAGCLLTVLGIFAADSRNRSLTVAALFGMPRVYRWLQSRDREGALGFPETVKHQNPSA